MSSMNSYVSLDPAARPVDRFLQADVAKPTDTNPALQLAASLREFNPKLQGVLDRQFSAYKRASELRATKDVLSKRLDNMASFKKAVDDGEIPWADNPWSMAQAEQEVAKAEARKIALGFDKILEENPEVRFGDDPNAVSALFDQHFSDFAQNLSPFAAEAAVPELDAMKSRILSQWSNQRSRERGAEREESFKDGMSSLFVAGSKFDSEDASIAQAQQLLDNALRTVDPVTANGWLFDSLKDAAIQKGDAGLPARVLSKIKGNGGASLANTAAARDLQRDVSLSVTTDTARKMREAAAIREEQAKNWKNQVSDLSIAWKKDNPAGNLRDFKLPQEVIDAAPPGALSEWIKENLALDSAMSSAQSRDEADAGRAILTQAEAAIRGGESPTRVFGRLLPAAIALKADSELTTLVDTLRQELANTPDAISRRASLYSMDQQNLLTPAMVANFVNEGLIPEKEADAWLAKSITTKSDPLIRDALNNEEGRIRAFFVERKSPLDLFGNPLAAEAIRARVELNDRFIRWSMDPKNNPRGQEAYEFLRRTTDEILSASNTAAPAQSSSALPNETKSKK
jgi:hypothetical protein